MSCQTKRPTQESIKSWPSKVASVFMFLSFEYFYRIRMLKFRTNRPNESLHSSHLYRVAAPQKALVPDSLLSRILCFQFASHYYCSTNHTICGFYLVMFSGNVVSIVAISITTTVVTRSLCSLTTIFCLLEKNRSRFASLHTMNG